MTRTKVKLAMLTCLWGRPRISKLVLEHVAALRIKGARIIPVAVYSREDPHKEDMICVPGVTFVECPNKPVSDKWNAGAQYLRGLNINRVMIFGSDDFIDAGYIAAALKVEKDYVMAQSAYFFDAPTGRMIYAKANRIGGGRVISRKLLEALDYAPWAGGHNKGIDGAMDRRIQELRIEPACIKDIRAEGGLIMGAKTGSDLSSFDHMLKLPHETVDPESLLRTHLPRQAEALLNWST